MKSQTPDNETTEELQQVLRPLASLISKSEKAQQKLKPGTWQHTMLGNNLKALHIASLLMNKQTDSVNTDRVNDVTHDALQEALHTFASMISKTENTQAKFSPGTSQHTLQQNRLKALRMAEEQIKTALDKGKSACAYKNRNISYDTK